MEPEYYCWLDRFHRIAGCQGLRGLWGQFSPGVLTWGGVFLSKCLAKLLQSSHPAYALLQFWYIWVGMREGAGSLFRTRSSGDTSMSLIVPSTPSHTPMENHWFNPVPPFTDCLGLERLRDCVALYLIVNLEVEYSSYFFYCFSMLWDLKAGPALRLLPGLTASWHF